MVRKIRKTEIKLRESEWERDGEKEKEREEERYI